jgi:hypothetical protein
MLDETELFAMATDMRQRHAHMKQKFDTNKDGRLDAGEREAMKKARANHRFDKLLQRFDANNDGALSQGEVSRATGRGGRPIRLQERFAAADADKDGVVTRAEFFNVAHQRHQRHRKRGHRGARSH